MVVQIQGAPICSDRSGKGRGWWYATMIACITPFSNYRCRNMGHEVHNIQNDENVSEYFDKWRRLYWTRTFKTVARQNAYNLSLAVHIPSSRLMMLVSLSELWSISSTDQCLLLKEACKHQAVSLPSEISWLWVWEAARGKGSFWIMVSHKLLTEPPIEARNY